MEKRKVDIVTSYIQELYTGILQNMSELGVTKFELNNVYYSIFDDIFITSIEFNQGATFIFDGINVAILLKLNLSNGKSIRINELPLDKFIELYHIFNVTKLAVIEKDDKADCGVVTKLKVKNKDIIITDPCYIIKENQGDKVVTKTKEFVKYPDQEKYDLIKKNGWDKYKLTMEQCLEQHRSMEKFYEAVSEYYKQIEMDKDSLDDWDLCEYGQNMGVLGIKKYLVSDTIYGDWSCTTYDDDSGKELGQFCADAGMVAVFLLDDVLKYNPDFDYHLKREWTTTWIKNFTGEIWIERRHNDDGEDSIHVVGRGNVNFSTEQTGA